MALGKKVFGAGLKDAKVRMPDGTLYDIFATVSAEGDYTVQETEIKGDDQVIGVFTSSPKETIKIKANAISFDVLQQITGNTFTSTSSDGEIAMGTNSEQNPPYFELQAFSNAKDENGNALTLKKVWHKVQVKTTKIVQANEAEVTCEMEAIAVQTENSIDTVPVVLDPARISTISFAS